jgi:hypothetical protein
LIWFLFGSAMDVLRIDKNKEREGVDDKQISGWSVGWRWKFVGLEKVAGKDSGSYERV